MNILNMLAVIIVLGFFAVIGAWMYYPPAGDNTTALATLNQLTGALTLAFGGIISYFFGSSTGSKAKDDVINQMATTAAGAPNGAHPPTPPVVPPAAP